VSNTEQLLGEVGIDAGLDGLLPSRRDDIAHSCRLDDRRRRAFLHRCHLATDGQALGDDGDERSVELVDSRTQPSQVG
jgi:hypothetical protein